MKKLVLILLAIHIPLISVHSFIEKTTPEHLTPAVNAEWAIIGAGPAGIAVLGLLLDAGIDPSSIIWVDPEFNVGRVGKYYSSVPANSLAWNFIAYINTCQSFAACDTPAMQRLKECKPDQECLLDMMIEPLKDITAMFRATILSLQDRVVELQFINNIWNIKTDKVVFTANHVILATGCKPRTLGYLQDKQIPLDLALNKEKLATLVAQQDTIGVVGDKHSAMLVLKYLSELPVARIINFYKNKPVYWTDPGHENSGLSGIAADWAKDIYENNPPFNLLKIMSKPELLGTWTPLCTKIIYAIGFERNSLPTINGKTDVIYDDTTGIIMPRLFGIGIAFPQQYVTTTGKIEHRIGMREFMEYAQKVMPLWMAHKNSIRHLLQFDGLLEISTVCMKS